MDNKAFLAIVLSFLVLYGYQTYFAPPLPPPLPVTEERVSSSVPGETLKESVPGGKTASLKDASKVGSEEAPASASLLKIEAKEVTYDGPLFKAVLSENGTGGLQSLTLNNFAETMEEGSARVERVNVNAGDALPLSLSFKSKEIDIPTDAVAQVTSTGRNEFLFSQSGEKGVRVERHYRFNPDNYTFDLEVKIVNRGVTDITGDLSLHLVERDTEEGDRYSFIGQVAKLGEEVEQEAFTDLEGEAYRLEGDLKWVGFTNKYFITALIPKGEEKRSVVTTREGESLIRAELTFPALSIPAGKEKSVHLTVYSGPKDLTFLISAGSGLEGAIDFGWFHALAEPLLRFLKILYTYTGNYGFAIILVTILIKLVFFPLANKSYKSMKDMQKLQPIMAEMKEKYKDDKERMSKEMMQLYRKNRVNPLGGCLPMVVQIPVFIALYNVLINAIELRHAPFLFWITDMSAKDPYYITPVVMGATMFLQQKMSPSAPDPTQQKVMMMMPVIFTFMFLNFPSGLVIYWLVNNVLSIAQQYYILKKT